MALVDYSTKEGIAVLTLNDPPVNGYTHEMMKDLDAAIIEARFDNDVQVLIITGHGDKFFCAGANINMLREADTTYKYYFCLHANETLLRLEQTPKLCIAAINGHCVGGGLEIALACDFRVARKDDKLKMGLPEVNLGVLPGTGGTQRLARLVGKARAMQLMCEGNNFDFATGQTYGLLNELWDVYAAAFMPEVMQYARRFCRPNKANLAVGGIKRAIQSGLEVSLAEGLALERELQAMLFASDDAKEGLAAQSEKRKPVFKGK